VSAPPSDAAAPPAILALGSSGNWCTVALGLGRRLECRDEHAPNGHAERLLPLARELLDRAGIGWSDLGLIAFDAGPGSFTGLRIGCGLAQGLALGIGCPVVPVGSLAALAWPHRARPVFAATDARMGEIYSASFDRLSQVGSGARPECVDDPAAAAPEAVLGRLRDFALRSQHGVPGASAPGDAWVAAGDAFSRHPELARRARELGGEVVSDAFPGASALVALAATAWARGEARAADEAAPVYVRDKVALDVDEQAVQRLARGREP
jgi:tRNA threonylcarbamoyladenosine biosynthesis protein TsaB